MEHAGADDENGGVFCGLIIRTFRNANDRLTTDRRQFTVDILWVSAILKAAISGSSDGRCPACRELHPLLALFIDFLA